MVRSAREVNAARLFVLTEAMLSSFFFQWPVACVVARFMLKVTMPERMARDGEVDSAATSEARG